MSFFKGAIFQRIFFTIGFSFLAAMAFKLTPILIGASKSSSYQRHECEIKKIGWINKADDRKLDLEYSYQFQGETYHSHRYMWGLDFFTNQNRHGAFEFSKRVSVGQTHGCFVDSTNPNVSVINPGSALKTYELWVLIIFFLLFGWGFFVSWFYPKEAEKIFIPSDPS